MKFQGEKKGHGKARTEVGLILWRDPDRVVAPDACFITNKSLPIQLSREGYLDTIPEFVVEIRSKNDSADYVQHKATDYLKAGVEIVWIVDPAAKTVAIHTSHGEPDVVGEADTLELPGVIPGFLCQSPTCFRCSAAVRILTTVPPWAALLFGFFPVHDSGERANFGRKA